MPYAAVNDPAVDVNDPDVGVNGWYDEPPPDPGDPVPVPVLAGVRPVSGLDPSRRIRQDRFAWELLDRGRNHVAWLHPDRDRAPSLTMSISGVGRAIRGLRLPAGEAARLDPSAHRIRPAWVDADGEPWPLGVYVVGDVEQVTYSGGALVELTLADESAILEENVNRSLSWPRGTPVADAITRVVGLLPFPDVEVDPTLATLVEPVSFAVASTPWVEVCTVLARAAGMLTPHFTNAGVLRWRVAPQWDTAQADHTFSTDPDQPGRRAVLRGVATGLQTLGMPNVFYAVDSGAGDAQVAARYELPAAAPGSVPRVGREIPETVSVSGLEAGETALDAAKAAAAESLDAAGPATLEAPFDPRHDLYDLVVVDGLRYRDVGGSVDLSAGGRMSRTLRRVWTAQDPVGTMFGGLLP